MFSRLHQGKVYISHDPWIQVNFWHISFIKIYIFQCTLAIGVAIDMYKTYQLGKCLLYTGSIFFKRTSHERHSFSKYRQLNYVFNSLMRPVTKDMPKLCPFAREFIISTMDFSRQRPIMRKSFPYFYDGPAITALQKCMMFKILLVTQHFNRSQLKGLWEEKNTYTRIF